MPGPEPFVPELRWWIALFAGPCRSQKEWHHRFADQFGLPDRPVTSDPQWRPIRTPPDLPPPGRVPQVVEPTASALRWDAAIGRCNVPLRAPSVASSSKRSVASLPSMRTVSISSSADRRRELLLERHGELQAQLQLVEQMLSQAKPSTMISMASGVSAYSAATSAARSAVSAASAKSAKSAAKSAASGTSASAVGSMASARSTASMRRGQEEALPVPLLLDTRESDYATLSPFRSGTGVGLALPGAALSSTIGPP